jgi:hypothetical protein
MSKLELTRRELLAWGATIGAAYLIGDPMTAAQAPLPAVAAVDHLLLGVADLDRGIAWVEQVTGVKAVVGGSHPGVGTRNALLSLGGRQYLEIIAPDPAQAAFKFRTDIRKLTEPRMIGWAAVTTDVDGLAKRVRDGGSQIFGPRDGSRARPDGRMLKWRTLGVLAGLEQDGVDPVPFFIQWAADSVHPSQDSPPGCQLLALDIEHPDPAAVTASLKQVGIQATARKAQNARLIVSLKTPKGNVELR